MSCSQPPIDENCSDPAYRAAHPDECEHFPLLILLPEYALTEPSRAVTYTVILRANGREIVVEQGLEFSSSNLGVAVINSIGVATGVTPGIAAISVTWQGLSAAAQLEVISNCAEIASNFAVVIDSSKSMSQSFSPAYATKLSFSKQAARDFISSIDISKDQVSVWELGDSATELYELGTDITEARSAVAGISQTNDKTNIATSLQEVFESLPGDGTKVVVLFSDFEWTGTDPHEVCETFKTANGFLVIVATEAWGEFFQDAAECASGGFLLSAYDDTEDTIVPSLLGLKSFVCNQGCNDSNLEVPYAELNYLDWINFTVTAGRVDLIGNGVWDVKEGEGRGMYLDLQGSGDGGYPNPGQDFGLGQLTSKEEYTFEAGKTYSIAFLQGGSLGAPAAGSWTIKVTAGDHVFLPDEITDGAAPFELQEDEWVQVDEFTGPLIFEQLTQSGHHNVGTLIDEIVLRNETDDEVLLEDNFDEENPTVLPVTGGYYKSCITPSAQTASLNPPTPRLAE